MPRRNPVSSAVAKSVAWWTVRSWYWSGRLPGRITRYLCLCRRGMGYGLSGYPARSLFLSLGIRNQRWCSTPPVARPWSIYDFWEGKRRNRFHWLSGIAGFSRTGKTIASWPWLLGPYFSSSKYWRESKAVPLSSHPMCRARGNRYLWSLFFS